MFFDNFARPIFYKGFEMKERETLSKSHFMIIGQGVLEIQGVTDKHTWVEYLLLKSVKHHLTFLELFSNLLAHYLA